MLKTIIAISVIFVLVLPVAAEVATGPTAQEDLDTFVRIKTNEKKEMLAMEAAIVRFGKRSSEGDLIVDLVAAVHVAEKSYYQTVNKLFSEYDTVLYELIAPENHKIDDRVEKDPSLIGRIQLGITDLLGLTFQLKEVNYNAPNFVHADLSPEGFSVAMKERGETLQSMIFRILSASMLASQAPGKGGSELLLMLTMLEKNTPERALRLRRIFANEFKDIDKLISAINGSQGSTLIGGRNDKALSVLKEQIKLGKKKFAIFYGGGHMPDFQKKLTRDLGFKRKSIRWLEAWNLRLE